MTCVPTQPSGGLANASAYASLPRKYNPLMNVYTSPMVAPSGDRRRCASAERASFRSRNPARLPAELAGESRKTWCAGGIILGIYVGSRSRADRRRGARDRRLEPRQGALPEAEVHEARSGTLLPRRPGG